MGFFVYFVDSFHLDQYHNQTCYFCQRHVSIFILISLLFYVTCTTDDHGSWFNILLQYILVSSVGSGVVSPTVKIRKKKKDGYLCHNICIGDKGSLVWE